MISHWYPGSLSMAVSIACDRLSSSAASADSGASIRTAHSASRYCSAASASSSAAESSCVLTLLTAACAAASSCGGCGGGGSGWWCGCWCSGCDAALRPYCGVGAGSDVYAPPKSCRAVSSIEVENNRTHTVRMECFFTQGVLFTHTFWSV